MHRSGTAIGNGRECVHQLECGKARCKSARSRSNDKSFDIDAGSPDSRLHLHAFRRSRKRLGVLIPCLARQITGCDPPSLSRLFEVLLPAGSRLLPRLADDCSRRVVLLRFASFRTAGMRRPSARILGAPPPRSFGTVLTQCVQQTIDFVEANR